MSALPFPLREPQHERGYGDWQPLGESSFALNAAAVDGSRDFQLPFLGLKTFVITLQTQGFEDETIPSYPATWFLLGDHFLTRLSH